MQMDPRLAEIRSRLQPFRQLLESHFYNCLQLEPEACVELWNVITLIHDDLGAIGLDLGALARANEQLHAIARDIDPARIDHDAPEPISENGGKPAKVLAFRRPALPPRRLYEPAGPGGAA